MRIPFARHSYQTRSKSLSTQRLVNLYPEANPQDTKAPVALIGSPGLVEFCDLGIDKPVHGLHKMNGVLYAVCGNTVFSINSVGTVTTLGTIGANSDRVIMANNGDQIAIVKTDGTAYIATTTTVTQITDGDFRSPSSVTYQDGYFVFTEKDSQILFSSRLRDGTDYDALDFTSAESKPDDAVAVFADHGEVWAFGTEATEVYYNAAETAFPFARVTQALIERGCASRFAIAKEDNTVFWLGDDYVIYRADGYTPQRISTHPIEYAIAQYSIVSDAYGFVYTQEGHKFYVLIFPSGNATWVYDIATNLWHERESFDIGRWRVNSFAYCYDKNMVGDYTNGKIYYLDLDTYTEDGETMQAIAHSPPIWRDNRRFSMSEFRVDFDAGVGLTSGQGSDPQIMLQWSDDGGNTWSNEHWRDMGKIGEYYKRAVWRRLGGSRERTMRITISDPVKRQILGGYAEIQDRRE